MKLSWMKMVGSFFLAGVLTAPAWAAETAVPGTVNYVEGQVAIGDQALDTHSVGTALQPGQSITTNTGKVEFLLTPGVFVRVDDRSAVQLVAGSLTDTEVTVGQGQAMVEVTEIHPENNLRITEDGVSTRLLKTGLYDFDAAQNQIRVFSGKAVVFDGDREVKVGGGHQIDLNPEGKLKEQKFDKQQYEQSDLYRWSSLRSSYLAEANMDEARAYGGVGWYGPGWIGAGWYWDPWFDAYTFIPGDGIFYSPFGWGFYSPGFVYEAPMFFGGPPFVHQFGPGFHPPAAFARGGSGRGYGSWSGMGGRGMVNRGNGGIAGVGFHRGGSGHVGGLGFGGSGFHGGGGGFHGGGGGFHGGGGFGGRR